MINVTQTLKNLNDKFPDKSVKELIEILECIEESQELKLDNLVIQKESVKYPWEQDFMYFSNPPVYD